MHACIACRTERSFVSVFCQAMEDGDSSRVSRQEEVCLLLRTMQETAFMANTGSLQASRPANRRARTRVPAKAAATLHCDSDCGLVGRDVSEEILSVKAFLPSLCWFGARTTVWTRQRNANDVPPR